MTPITLTRTIAMALGLCAASAQAATLPTVTITDYNAAAFAAEQSALSNLRVETFETFAKGEVLGPLNTAVGAFETLGGTGSGSTVRGTSGNTGDGLYLRDKPVHGRVNTTLGGSRFVDSNDTYGIRWTIGGLGLFDRIIFNISDFGDAGGKLTVASGGDDLTTYLSGRRNGIVNTMAVQFAQAVDTAVLSFRMSKLNDGFGLDDVSIGSTLPPTSVTPVPLPPALLLLGGAAAGLVLLRKRMRAA